jgi:hypothetical protein
MKTKIIIIFSVVLCFISCEYENNISPRTGTTIINVHEYGDTIIQHGDTIIINGSSISMLDLLYPDGFEVVDNIDLGFSKAGTEYIVPNGMNLHCIINTIPMLNPPVDASVPPDSLNYCWLIDNDTIYIRFGYSKFKFKEKTRIRKIYNDSSSQNFYQSSRISGYLTNAKVTPVILDLTNTYTVPKDSFLIVDFSYSTHAYFSKFFPYQGRQYKFFEYWFDIKGKAPISYYKVPAIGDNNAYIFPPGTEIFMRNLSQNPSHQYYIGLDVSKSCSPCLINGYLREK